MWQFLQLFFIAIVNLGYNFGLAIGEVIQFGHYRWWWQLRGRLFINYFADGPFAIIKREGPRAPVALSNLIYGETPCLTMRRILQELSPTAQDHFVDLGCGRGLTVFFVRLYFQIPATGVEVIPSFVKRAEQLARQLRLTRIEFIRENLAWLTLDQIGSGTIFYLTGTTFEPEMIEKIALRLELLPKGVKLITLSEEFPSQQFQLTARRSYYFSWGQTDVYFHEKVA